MKRLVLSSAGQVKALRLCHQLPTRLYHSTKTGGIPEQASPLGEYYESILNNPSPYPEEKVEAPPASSTVAEKPEPAGSTSDIPKQPGRGRKAKEEKQPSPRGKPKASAEATSPPPSPATSPPTPTPPPSNVEAKARVIFGSRLLGPAEQAERLASMKERSSLVAGVLVPPRPEEPDNCCMSGCVNCVWDRFRDETELWASAHAEAERRLRAQEAAGTAAIPTSVDASPTRASDQPTSTMDDDGGGSAANWDSLKQNSSIAKDLWDDELYKNLPVGIREFMKQEKRLKLKHEREGTVGG